MVRCGPARADGSRDPLRRTRQHRLGASLTVGICGMRGGSAGAGLRHPGHVGRTLRRCRDTWPAAAQGRCREGCRNRPGGGGGGSSGRRTRPYGAGCASCAAREDRWHWSVMGKSPSSFDQVCPIKIRRMFHGMVFEWIL